MTKTWSFYWSSLAAVTFSLSFWNNRRRFPKRSYNWLTLKSVVDSALVSLLAWKWPGILTGLAAGWITCQCTKESPWKSVLTAMVGTVLSSCGLGPVRGFLLPCCFGVQTLSDDLFLRYERATGTRQPRTLSQK